MTTCAKEGVKIEVGGHTDNVGNAAANVKLSEARANSLKALFVKAGIPADAINVKGLVTVLLWLTTTLKKVALKTVVSPIQSSNSL